MYLVVAGVVLVLHQIPLVAHHHARTAVRLDPVRQHSVLNNNGGVENSFGQPERLQLRVFVSTLSSHYT